VDGVTDGGRSPFLIKGVARTRRKPQLKADEEVSIRQAQRLNVFGQDLAALLSLHPTSSKAEFLERASRRGIPHMDTLRFLSEGVKALLVAQKPNQRRGRLLLARPSRAGRLSFVSGEQER
jgi:hypothetical protein